MAQFGVAHRIVLGVTAKRYVLCGATEPDKPVWGVMCKRRWPPQAAPADAGVSSSSHASSADIHLTVYCTLCL